MPLIDLTLPSWAHLPSPRPGSPSHFAQAALWSAPCRGEGRGDLGRGGVLAEPCRVRGPRRVAFLSSARGGSGRESLSPAPRGPLCTDGPARTRREAAWQAAAPAASAEGGQGRGRGSLRRAGPQGPALAP